MNLENPENLTINHKHQNKLKLKMLGQKTQDCDRQNWTLLPASGLAYNAHLWPFTYSPAGFSSWVLSLSHYLRPQESLLLRWIIVLTTISVVPARLVIPCGFLVLSPNNFLFSLYNGADRQTYLLSDWILWFMRLKNSVHNYTKCHNCGYVGSNHNLSPHREV